MNGTWLASQRIIFRRQRWAIPQIPISGLATINKGSILRWSNNCLVFFKPGFWKIQRGPDNPTATRETQNTIHPTSFCPIQALGSAIESSGQSIWIWIFLHQKGRRRKTYDRFSTTYDSNNDAGKHNDDDCHTSSMLPHNTTLSALSLSLPLSCGTSMAESKHDASRQSWRNQKLMHRARLPTLILFIYYNYIIIYI